MSRPGGDGGRKRPLSPELTYDSDDAGDIIEVPVVYGSGSLNSSNRADMYRLGMPLKVPHLESGFHPMMMMPYPESPPLNLPYRDVSPDRSNGFGRGDRDRSPPRRIPNRQGSPRRGSPRRRSPPRAFGNPELEERLVQLISQYLTSISINPYNGSVPIERIQNVVRDRHKDLYTDAVGSGKNTWGKFLDRHTDVFRVITDGEKKRICLRSQQNWEEGDQLEMQERTDKEVYLIRAMFQFFQLRGNDTCKVDDFMEAYAALPMNAGPGKVPELPARGDFVRFVKRHSGNFMYNPRDLEITLLSSKWPAPKTT